MTKQSESKLYFGGVPTKPDVDKLIEKFGIPQEETLIKWEEIEAVLREHRRSHRFATVTGAWRKLLFRQHNCYMIAVSGQGLRCAPPEDWVHDGFRKANHGMRSIRRGATLCVRVDRMRLKDDDRKAADNLSTIEGRLKTLALCAPKPLDKNGNGKGD